jgi:hypothetical protein
LLGGGLLRGCIGGGLIGCGRGGLLLLCELLFGARGLGGLLGCGLLGCGLLHRLLLDGRVDLLGHVAVGAGKFGEGVHESSFSHLGDAADTSRTRESLKLRKSQAAEGGAVPHGIRGGGGVGHD